MAVKKAFLFTVDAIIGAIIIFSAMLILSRLYIEDTQVNHLSFLANDVLNVLSELKMGEVNNSYVDYLISIGQVEDLNKSIIEQISEYYVLNQSKRAVNLFRNITGDIFPANMGISLAIANEEIYVKNYSNKKTLIAARKMISGYEKDKPIVGSSARAYLQSISDKTASSFAYFGGFVGQGNLTRDLDPIQSDGVIISSFAEFDTPSSFNYYINDNFCALLTPSLDNFSSTRWNTSSCNALFIPGAKNNISIKFTGQINESFIAGGYVKVDYTTKNINSNDTSNLSYYYFPGIEGLINLYSSFDIPGTLQSIDLFLHFYNNKTTFLNIGNATIFTSSGSDSDQIINISSVVFPLSAQTVPIRLGTGNLSEGYNTTSGEPSDSLLVTDVSGSMDDCAVFTADELCQYDCWRWFFYQGQRQCEYTGMCSDDQCGTCNGFGYWTNNHQVVNNCSATKLDLAKQANLDFIDVVLNLTGNEVGLVSYENDVDSTEAITDIKINLQSEINSYNANGATCICCGINNAKDMLLATNDAKFMLVMSDGQENRFCDNFFDYTGASSGSVDSIDAGQNACNQNITVFSVGFGIDADHDTLKQVACNESLYYNGSNVENLTEIYKAIGEQILVIANFSSQIIEISGDFQKSFLYPDSFIKFNYTPQQAPPSFGEIELILETPKFSSCNPVVNIPPQVRISDAKLLSYSGAHWTSYLEVNSNVVFDISIHGDEYNDIGDPFVIRIPPSYLQNGDNQLIFDTADDPINSTGCSTNNSMVYTLLIKSSVSYSDAYPFNEGCAWSIEAEDLEIINIEVPSEYSGTKACSYNSTDIVFDVEDSIDQAVHELLLNLDFDGNGRINVNIEAKDLEIEALWVSQVPYLWGPEVLEVRVWQ